MTFDDDHSCILKVPIFSTHLFSLFPAADKVFCRSLLDQFIDSDSNFLKKLGAPMKAWISNCLPSKKGKPAKRDK